MCLGEGLLSYLERRFRACIIIIIVHIQTNRTEMIICRNLIDDKPRTFSYTIADECGM